MNAQKEVVLVTGSSGFIGRALVEKLVQRYAVICLDLKEPPKLPAGASFVAIDLTSDEGTQTALQKVREQGGNRVASVIHLAGYFDLTGEPNPKYEAVTVRGTERLLWALQDFDVEQFAFSSTMLVHKPGRPGQPIDEQQPIEPKLPYRTSKVETEKLIHIHRGGVPIVYLRPAGVYDDLGRSPFIARQIARIYERSPKSHAYPGYLETGQSFLHLDDLTDAVMRLVERRTELPAELPLLLGEPEAMGYETLQREIGRLIYGKDWQTWKIPKALAKTGVWLEDDVFGENPFIRSWMVDIADDHYELDITRAQSLIGWTPKHSLRKTLPKIITALKEDPAGWYEANKLNAARVAAEGLGAPTPPPEHKMHEHMDEMREMHLGMLWVHFLNIGLGLWLITSPFALGLFDPETAQHIVRDVTAERDLPPPELRNTLIGISDIVSGILVVIFGMLSLSQRFSWAQ